MKDREELLQFTVPLGLSGHRLAQQASAYQHEPQKAKQVYLNTLAIFAVNFFLKCMEIESNWKASDSYDPLLQTFLNVADLEVTGIGKLECCPVIAGTKMVYIPPEAWEERIGYVVVQFDASLREATLIGFIKTLEETEQLFLNQLQPLEGLLDYLHELKSSVAASEAVSVDITLINLNQWFQNIFENDWRPLNQLHSQQADKPVFTVRSGELLQHKSNSSNPVVGISGCKVIDLGILISGHPFTLIVTFAPSAEGEVDILTQLFPARGQIYLPEGAELLIINAAGEIFLQTTARIWDNWIQLQFSVELGERFSIQVTFADASLTEYFVI